MQLILMATLLMTTNVFATAPSGSATKSDIQQQQEELKRLEQVKFHTRDDEKILKPSKEMEDYTNMREKRDTIPKSNILRNPNP